MPPRTRPIPAQPGHDHDAHGDPAPGGHSDDGHGHAAQQGHHHAHDARAHDHHDGPAHRGHDGHDNHDHGHHHHAPAIDARNERLVLGALVATGAFMVAEVVGGFLSGSLALIADAGHMLTDTAALALAWAGFRFGRRAPDARRSYGYLRFEVLAGFVNALALILLVIWIAWEAAMRLISPAPVLAGPMFVIAVLGLLVNAGVFWLLSRGDRDHINIKGALLHVLGDLLGSVAAILAAVVIWATGWTPVDPILSVLLSALVLRSGWALLKSSLHILMEGVPPGLDLPRLRADLREVPGVADVDHIHVWSITSGRVMATMTLRLAEGARPAAVTAALKSRLAERHGIGHSTVEIDWEGAGADCTIGPAEARP